MYRHHNFGNNRRLNFKAIACVMIAIGVMGLGFSLAMRGSQKNGLQNTVTEPVAIPQIAHVNVPLDNNAPAQEDANTSDPASAVSVIQNTAADIAVPAAPTTQSQVPATPVEQPLPVNAPENTAATGSTPQTTQVAPPITLEMPPHDYAGVRINGSVVEIKFATGKTYVADSTRAMLANTAKAGARNKYVTITTFNNPQQDPKTNERLAQERGLKIKQLLTELGVPAKQVILLKPQSVPVAGLQNTFPQVLVVKVEDSADYPPEMILADAPVATTR